VQIEPRVGDLVIGRRRGSDIELPFAEVSDQHARLSRGEQGWLLADLGSANGTSVNGHRLMPFVVQALAVGDILRLASVELVFEGEGGPAPGADGQAGAAESTATLARRLVSDLFGRGRPTEVARVVVTDGPARDRELRLDVVGCCYRVGRGAGCDLVVPDDDISREHAEFERRWDGVFVRDLDSKNGVLLLGERLASERRLSDGDVLRLGQTTFRLDDPEDRYLRQLEEVEGCAGQAAKAGADAEPAPSGDPDSREGGAVLSETHPSLGPGGKRPARRSLIDAASSSPIASSQSMPVGRGRRPQRHAPLALMVIAALVLVGAIVLALSFILGT
jgi:pSer/pThr/pTyr-binding forkhead associated (FHA) protein